MTPKTDPAARPPIAMGLAYFAAAYATATLMLGAFVALTELRTNSGLSMAALMAAALYASQKFAKRVGRSPQGAEVWQLVVGSFLVATAMSMALTLATIVAMGGGDDIRRLISFVLEKLSPVALLVGLTFIVLLHIAALWIAYGPLGRYVLRRTARG